MKKIILSSFNSLADVNLR